MRLGRHASRFVEVDRRANGWPAQIREVDNLHHTILLLMQTDHPRPSRGQALLAPLMQLGKALVAGIVIAHAKTMNRFARILKTSSCRIYNPIRS